MPQESPILSDMTEGLRVQGRVVSALVLRELRTRFGQHQLGYLWAVIMPLAIVVLLTTAHLAIGRRAAHGASLEVLLLSGMIAWLTFADARAYAATAYQGNRPLLVYPMVHVLDIVTARALLELATKFGVLAALITLYWAWGVDVAMEDPLAVIGIMTAMCLGGAALGHIGGCIQVFLPSFRFFMGVLHRVLFLTSGALFLLSDIPAHWREVLLLNPLAHLIDFMRGAWLLEYSPLYADFSYVAGWAAGLLAATALVETATRPRRAGARA